MALRVARSNELVMLFQENLAKEYGGYGFPGGCVPSDTLVLSNSSSWGQGRVEKACLLLSLEYSSQSPHPKLHSPHPPAAKPFPRPPSGKMDSLLVLFSLSSFRPSHPGEDDSGGELNAVLGEHREGPSRIRRQQETPVDAQDTLSGVGGHQEHSWRPQAAPHVVQGGVAAHCLDMKQVLGIWPARDNLHRHLEHGVVGRRSKIRNAYRQRNSLWVEDRTWTMPGTARALEEQARGKCRN